MSEVIKHEAAKRRHHIVHDADLFAYRQACLVRRNRSEIATPLVKSKRFPPRATQTAASCIAHPSTIRLHTAASLHHNITRVCAQSKSATTSVTAASSSSSSAPPSRPRLRPPPLGSEVMALSHLSLSLQGDGRNVFQEESETHIQHIAFTYNLH